MASRDITKLSEIVQPKAQEIIQICYHKGVDLLIYCTLRDLEEQAKLYRQSRSYKAIKAKMQKFKDRGYGFLADIIEQVGPCSGPHVTNAAPGESWHGYGEAFDAVPLINGKAAWANIKYYNIYGQAVRDVGMKWAGDWSRFKELPHAQLRDGSNPLKILTPDQVQEILNYNGLINV